MSRRNESVGEILLKSPWWVSCGVMKRKRNGAKITAQVSADGRAESSPFQGGVRHGGIENGKSWRRGAKLCGRKSGGIRSNPQLPQQPLPQYPNIHITIWT